MRLNPDDLLNEIDFMLISSFSLIEECTTIPIKPHVGILLPCLVSLISVTQSFIYIYRNNEIS